MKKFTIILALLFCVSVFAQKTISHRLDSYELGESRNLKIYVPPSYEQDSSRYYPIAVVLDAEYLFDLYVGNSVLFSKKDKAPEQIIIGIDQNYKDKRYEDCAYDKVNSLPSGKSDEFYRFVRGELLDYMEENYRVSPFKTIVGNTLTANFTNYFFIEDIPGFSAFININPYFAPDVPTMLQKNATEVQRNSYYYYLSSGDYLSEKKLNAITTANSILAPIENEKFNYKYDNFDGSTSISSIGQSLSSAFAFIFEIYSSISKEEFDTKIKDLSPADAIAYLENKYVEIEYQFGSNLNIRERDIYAIESIVIDKENGEYLRDFGEMIYKLYPESPLSDYYIGLDYEMRGKYKRALEAYKEGYMKVEGSPEDAENFYKNVERVSAKVN
ncbi:alpha/beta hydrolase [Urechidicola croceus]|uniref:Esterase n=1 Tax=Urechidicola croceus TaxID=1850246 RepID=A0A1D8P3V0_9FLAO|nr:alpha/beta hydrolase-fold protein [Urechidicola croceus]AOW19254.1 hypothetical protein LPB138_00490 [Urechidicola croceus]